MNRSQSAAHVRLRLRRGPSLERTVKVSCSPHVRLIERHGRRHTNACSTESVESYRPQFPLVRARVYLFVITRPRTTGCNDARISDVPQQSVPIVNGRGEAAGRPRRELQSPTDEESNAPEPTVTTACEGNKGRQDDNGDRRQ